MSFDVRSRWTPTIAAVDCGSDPVTLTVLLIVELTIFDVLPPGGPTGRASLSPFQICPWPQVFGAAPDGGILIPVTGLDGGEADVLLAMALSTLSTGVDPVKLSVPLHEL